MSLARALQAGSQTVDGVFVCPGRATFSQLVVAGGVPGQVLTNAGAGRTVWASDGGGSACCALLQTEVANLNIEVTQIQRGIAQLHSQLDGLTAIVAGCCSIPPPVTGHKVTFFNSTSATTLDLYITVGGATPSGPTLLTTFAPGASYQWPAPGTYNWSGNFQAWPTGTGPAAGATLFEIGFNQPGPPSDPQMRASGDISTVPPGLGNQCADGPRDACVLLSRAAGFSDQQSYGYNVGMRWVPPVTALLPPQVPVECISTDGNCPGSIGYPNDTAYPKQQTMYDTPTSDHEVYFLDPVA